MSDVSGATGESLPPTIDVIPTPDTSPISARDAAAALSQHRWKRDAKAAKEAEAPPPPPQEIPPAQAEEDAAPPQEAPGEDQTTEVEQPVAEEEAPAPLELPRSWSKDQTEVWKTLPPDTQQYLLDQDSKATRAVRQAQNEAAESRKSIETERAALEQAKGQYEQALPVLLQTLQQQQMGEFADIKSQADVERMAREDWPRYALWDAKQKQVQAVNAEVQRARQSQQQEFRTQWDKFAKDEDARFLEAAPEMQDETRASAVRNRSLNLLKDVGFSDEDLSKLWNGEISLSLRDHRAQLLIRDAVRYREAQTNAKTKATRPVPTVQRPGSPASRAPEAEIRDKRLEQQFEKTASWKDAAELLIARRSRR